MPCAEMMASDAWKRRKNGSYSLIKLVCALGPDALLHTHVVVPFADIIKDDVCHSNRDEACNSSHTHLHHTPFYRFPGESNHTNV